MYKYIDPIIAEVLTPTEIVTGYDYGTEEEPNVPPIPITITVDIGNVIVKRLSDSASIPPDYANADYKEYLEWRKTNTPDPAETAQETSDRLAKEQRRADIQAARTTSGARELTHAQAEAYIDSQVANITNIASAKTTIATLFKKIIPYIID